ARLYLVVAFAHTAATDIYPLSLHDALPICTSTCAPCRTRPRWPRSSPWCRSGASRACRSSTSACSTPSAWCRAWICSGGWTRTRSEEHTSELQSHLNLVCRLLLEKKKHHTI